MFRSCDTCIHIFIIIGILSRSGEGQNVPDVPYRVGRVSGSCRLDQFQCDNGDCIASEFLCDGKAECPDSSDETSSQCLRPEITCPEYAFRCSYGACVDGDVKCNGKDDCIDRSDETLPECQAGSDVTSKTTIRPGCTGGQFRCGTGRCIDGLFLCDGSPDCADRSDETAAVCGSNQCVPFNFRCTYGACIDGDKKCDGVGNCADGSDEGESACRGIQTTPTPPGREPTPGRPHPFPPSGTPWTPTSQGICPQPPGIQNGYWKLHSSQCPINHDHCEPREGMNMVPGTHLVYICNHGYQLTNVGDVYCASGGKWSNVPQCTEIRCKVLDTSSTKADCSLNGKWTSCGTPVLPRTQAHVSCRTSYRQEDSVWQRDSVTCNSQGQWEPEPIKCIPGPVVINIHVNGTSLTIDNISNGNHNVTKIVEIFQDRVVVYGERGGNELPDIDVRMGLLIIRVIIAVCGIKPPKYVRPLVVEGQTPIITDFPWHATIYRTNGDDTEKKFICGATVITENLLITAAHCVFDEGIKKPDNPRNFVIATGNFFRDYDYVYPPPIVVRKAQVKKIYMNCDYQGLDGNYDRDIAILHIEPSINFTAYLAPICLDTSIRSLAIDLGTNGVVAGFGRTAQGPFSSILQSLSVPVVPKNVCIRESNEVNARRFVTADKFCAGYKNGSSVCDGDSGGGLTFETNNLWYIRGIVSSGLGAINTGGTRTCDNTRYAVYTEISFHTSWIQDIMLKVEQRETIPGCSTRTRRRRRYLN